MAETDGAGGIKLFLNIDTSRIKKDLKTAINEIGNFGKKISTSFDEGFASVEEKKDTIELLTQAIKDQEQIVKGLQAEYAKLTASKGQFADETKVAKTNLQNETAVLKDLKGSLFAISPAPVKKVTTAFGNFGKRLMGIVKSALIFSVLYKILQKLLAIFKSVLLGDQEFAESLKELQVALWALVTPLLNVVIPAVKTMVNVLTDVVVVAGKFFATLSGKSYNSLIEQAKGFQKMSKGAKEAKKELAGFDDLQIINGGNKDEGLTETDFDKFKTESGDNVPNVSEQLSAVITSVGGLIAAIGLILLLNTKNPVAHSIGIGMIIAGAGIFAVGAVQTMANNMDEDIGNMLHGIIAIVSGLILAIGIILLFMGQITPLSIGMVVAGAVGLVSEIALYPEKIIEAIRGPLGVVLAIVSTALLVIGIILLCSGVITPITIGMVVAGAVGLAATVAINWNAIVDTVSGIFKKFGGIIAAAGVALIVLGIILCCTGVGVGLGIGLIIAGAAGIAGAVAFNWNAIVDWLKGVWDAVKQFWNRYIAPVFTAKWWADLGKKAINGLIGIVEKGINFLIDKINVFVRGIDKVVSAVGEIFGADWSVATIPNVKIPRLAQGAVIPPNKEFLAVLGDQKHGTNIEAPLQTIVDAFNIALSQNGGGAGNTEVILEIDGREFGRAVVEQGNRENRRIGTRLVMA